MSISISVSLHYHFFSELGDLRQTHTIFLLDTLNCYVRRLRDEWKLNLFHTNIAQSIPVTQDASLRKATKECNLILPRCSGKMREDILTCDWASMVIAWDPGEANTAGSWIREIQVYGRVWTVCRETGHNLIWDMEDLQSTLQTDKYKNRHAVKHITHTVQCHLFYSHNQTLKLIYLSILYSPPKPLLMFWNTVWVTNQAWLGK